ncbi:MAG: type II secretion system protein GspG [Congregibacter sp.]
MLFRSILRLSVTLPVIGLLNGCASIDTGAYQSRLISTLPNKREVSFRGSVQYPGNILCGSYEALDFDGYRNYTSDYIVGPEIVIPRPSETQLAVYCSNDSAAGLYEQTGVGGDDESWPIIKKVSADMLAIEAAINMFYGEFNIMPRNIEQFLEGDFAVPAEVLLDPWARPYRYEEGLAGRSTPQYKLYTLGADGAAGGSGSDADISKQQLGLILHVLRVRDI